jgi:Cu+-exporting ATPase
VTDIVPDDPEILRAAASVERRPEHPLAEAVLRAAAERGLELEELPGFVAVPGRGAEAAGVAVGNRSFFADRGMELPDASAAEAEGKTIVFVARDGSCLGYLAIADRIKDETGDVVAALRGAGVRLVLLTGDRRPAAEALANKLGISDVVAEVLPQDKADRVRELRGRGRTVAMVGDGINDAPALAEADLGVALGTGTDVAMEAADVTLVRGDLRALLDALHIARRTMRTVKQNLFLAFVYNSVAIPFAAFGLLNPMIAAGAMSLSSLSVVGNALRLRRA